MRGIHPLCTPTALPRKGLKPIPLYFVRRCPGGFTFGLHITVMHILVFASKLDDERCEGHECVCPLASVTHHPLSVPEPCRDSGSVRLLSSMCQPYSERALCGPRPPPPRASSQTDIDRGPWTQRCSHIPLKRLPFAMKPGDPGMSSL